jgi:Domain of unknown function (DUF4440)
MAQSTTSHHADKAVIAAILLAGVLAATGATASQEEEVRAAFDQFVRAQNTHDVRALSDLLVDSPQFIWITRGAAVWGRDAALQRFAALYEGSWRLDPELASLRVVPMSDDVAQLCVPVEFTTGAPGQPPAHPRFLVNLILVKHSRAWLVKSILPIPAPAT